MWLKSLLLPSACAVDAPSLVVVSAPSLLPEQMWE